MTSFLAFLRNKQYLTVKQTQALGDSAGLAKTSFFQYLCKERKILDRPVEFDELCNWVKEWGIESNFSVVDVTDTKGWDCDVDIYKNAGGINSSIAAILLPLVNTETGERVAVTVRPTEDNTILDIKRYYRDMPHSIGLCSPLIWSGLYRLYVEPLLVGKMAEKIVASTKSNISKENTTMDSDARRLYRLLMNVGLERGASDVHFIPCEDKCMVIYRIDGVNQHYTDIPIDIVTNISNIFINDGSITRDNPKKAVDGKIRYSPSAGSTPNDEVDLRISIMPSKRGFDINVRYLSSKLFTFEEIGMSSRNIELFKKLLDLPNGMIVQVGPTGSGKSTSLYAGLSYIHESLRNIIAVEDPVEILMNGISQIDVDSGEKPIFSFSDALKSSLRHDPDVIVVGELRDFTSADIAIQASNTGHLVITSSHTNDSIGVFERLINMGIDPYSLGEVIVAVMGQRLVRRLCPYCKQPYYLDLKSEEARFFNLPNKPEKVKFFKPHGCAKCYNTGYKGRIAINEILVVDSTLRHYIQKHEPRKVFEEYLRSQKFKSMYSDGIEKALKGITSLDEMRKYAADILAFKG